MANGSADAEGRTEEWTRRAFVTGLAAVPAAAAAWAIARSLGDTSHPAPAHPDAAHPAAVQGVTVKPPAPRWITIAEENARPGTGGWAITQDPVAWDKVRGFASRTSVATGERFHLYVSTAAPEFTVTAYRMGHYGGKGGRQVWTSGPRRGHKQAPPRIDRSTNLRDAPWRPSVEITADERWVPGSYLFKLVSSDGGESQIPLVVRDDHHPGAVHIQHDVTTWQAYNKWGGASLYTGDHGRSTKVSFDRPYDLSGSGNFLGGVHEICALVESLGLEVTYSTNLDSHARPADASRHRVWISPAHDEYWSWEMRQGVQAARDKGVNLMFLGANCMFRRIRLEPSPLGDHRVIVNYRDAKIDPLHGIDDKRVTTSWREQPAPLPESSLTGVFYESNPVSADMVIVDAGAWMFEGTGVRNGDRWPKLIGNEYDRVTPEMPTPESIQVLAHSPVVCRRHHSFSDMTYYTTRSGAGVFSTGTIWFERHLLPGGTGTDAQIVAMMTNLLRVFAKGPAGHTHRARSNLRRLRIRPGYLPTGWG